MQEDGEEFRAFDKATHAGENDEQRQNRGGTAPEIEKLRRTQHQDKRGQPDQQLETKKGMGFARQPQEIKKNLRQLRVTAKITAGSGIRKDFVIDKAPLLHHRPAISQMPEGVGVLQREGESIEGRNRTK